MLFKRFAGRVHFQFRDRIAAAETLGDIIKHKLRKSERAQILVLGIPRAGALTADIVCRKLENPSFGVIFPRKIRHPFNPEQSIGAVMEDGFTVFDHVNIRDGVVSRDYLKVEINQQLLEIARRKSAFLNSPNLYDVRKMISRFKTIVIVDDGAALGFTVITAVKWIRSMDEKNNLISKIIIALPVAPMETVQKMNAINNIETVISYSPSIIRFHSLEQYHQHFPEVTDQEVQAVMRNRNLL